MADVFCNNLNLPVKQHKNSHRQGTAVTGLGLHQARFSLWSLGLCFPKSISAVSFLIFAITRITR